MQTLIANKFYPFLLSRSDLWIVWRCHGILRVYWYYFCLEPTVRKDACMRTTSINAIFFSKVAFWKFLLNNYEAHWKQHFERSPTVEYFLDMDQLTCYIFHQDFSKHETKIDKSASKKISFTKIPVCNSKNIALIL